MTVLQILGVAAVVAGLFFLAWPLLLIAAGVAFVVVPELRRRR